MPGRESIPQASRTYPKIELTDTYAILGPWTKLHFAAEARRVGHKIGLAACINDGAQVPADRFMAPRSEVERVFVVPYRTSLAGVTIRWAVKAQPRSDNLPQSTHRPMRDVRSERIPTAAL